ncbi:hypothetical protein GF382_00005 [Candidatus Falkowbacteria bacterium]|nr:hypothetical protein [Candidatus Falkowbacteria bacterium]
MKNILKKLKLPQGLKKIFKGKMKEGGNFTLTIVLAIGIIIALNFISYQIFVRLDLTENKDFSISEASKRTVADLDDLVNIKVYFSKNLPPKFLTLEQQIKDILDEYENYSGGKVKVEFIDPAEMENPGKDLPALGIAPLQFNVMKNDSYEIVKGYMGMVIQYGSEQEAIPVINSSDNLEYTITSTIKKFISDREKIVGLVSSNLTLNAGKAARRLYQGLEDLYQVKEVDLASEEDLLVDVDTLIVLGPKDKFTEKQLRKIDEFVMSGKPLVLLVDGVVLDSQRGAIQNNIGLDDMLAKYGLRLNKDLIADVSNAKASIPSGFFNIVLDYPLWPKVVGDNFDQDNVIVASLESLSLFWASSIDIIEENINSEETEVSILAKSTKDACVQKDNFDIDPQSKTNKCSETGQYNFAVSLMGKIPSAFEEDKSADSRIILVADSDFPADRFYAVNSDNVIFFQNMIDGVTLDEDLITIRSRGVTERPIKKLEKGTKEFIRYANIFGMTVVVLAFGLIRYFLRRRKKDHAKHVTHNA